MHCSRLLPLFLLSAALFAREFYVSPTGDDDHSGASPEQAFRTPERALAAMRQARQDEAGIPLVLHLLPGTHRVVEALALDAALSGTAEAPTVIRASERGAATLSGFAEVTGWTLWRDGIWRAPAPVTQIAEVYWNGERLPAARVPNLDPANPRTGGMIYAYDTDQENPRKNVVFLPEQLDVSRWQNPATGRLVVWPDANWNCDVLPLESVDAETRRLTTARNARYDIRRGNRFYLEHLFEELDAPGEWFFDAADNQLYLMPPEPGDPAGKVAVPRAASLVRLLGSREAPVRHVRIEDLRLEGTTGHAVELQAASDCTLRACEITRTGGDGVWLHEGSSRNRIAGCDIAWTGTAAIRLLGSRNVARDRDDCLQDNVIENNHLHHVGMSRNAGGAVDIHPYVGGNITRGNIVRRNRIHDAPRKGIMFGGSNLVEGNHVHHVNLEQSDTGSIGLCTRDLHERGSIVRHNYLHDSGGYEMRKPGQWAFPSYCWGIYLDDWTSGVTLYGNVVVGSALGAFHVHGGVANVIENNLFVDNIQFQGLFSEKPPKVQDGVSYVMAENVVRRNIAVAAPESAWLVGTRTWRNGISECDRNLFWFGGGEPVTGNRRRDLWPWQEWLDGGFDRNSVLAPRNPVAFADGRYEVDAELAAQIGFEPIPWDRIGLYESPDRFSWPVRTDWPRETPVLEHPVPTIPARTATAPLPRLPADREPPKVDGILEDGEWDGAGELILARDHRDLPAQPVSTVRLFHTADALYLAVDNPSGEGKTLTAGESWGPADAVEIAMRVSGQPENSPIFLVRGYLGGRFGIADSVDGKVAGVGDVPREGLSEERLAAIRRCRFRHQQTAPNHWVAEFVIPWGAIPASGGQPVPLQFNLTTRKPAHNLWLMWHPTGRQSFGVGEEGKLLPAP